MLYFCCDERRRNAVRDHETLNGIDYLEVLDRDAPTKTEPNDSTKSLRQRTLLVRCLKAIPPFNRDNVSIEGGERITSIKVLWAFPASAFSTDPANAATELNALVTVEERNFFVNLAERDRILVVRTDTAGDFSTYRLYLRKAVDNPAPPDRFDPLVSAVDFSFKVECPSDFDCQTERVCPPEAQPQPEINYLAKDYASFRQLMLDRMALLMPQWRERNPADLGIALVELLAYVGDYLSYQQDAIATEAYLFTARRRTSVRRHARLVDYFMHDGCNARVWVQVWVNADLVRPKPANPNDLPPSPLPKGTKFLTQLPGQPQRLSPDSPTVLQALAPTATVFETMHDVEALFHSHNEMYFYTWGDRECCLPKGATRASLRSKNNQPLHLSQGDVLIFLEQRGPKTGNEADADLNKRHAVRLSQVEFTEDPLPSEPVQVVNIQWHSEDVLPFPLCLGEIEDPSQPGQQQQISIALGNIVLADRGLTIQEQQIKDGENDRVPSEKLFTIPISAGDRCQANEPKPVPPRFHPRLQQAPLTQTARVRKLDPITKKQQLVPFDPEASASAAFQWPMEDTIPAITLRENDSSRKTWQPRRDLLGSTTLDPHFVAEIEGDGFATLRFGNGQTDQDTQLGQHGLRPAFGTSFDATYRVGNGKQGNIGADTLFHIVIAANSAIEKIRNPLPAKGGVDPETIEDVRQNAPSAFRTQERAVTPADYAAVAERYPGIQQAAATFRWTGSWRTVFLTIDRVGGLAVDADFELKMRQHLERFRLAGHDVEIDSPIYVSLEIDMQVCVRPNYFRSQVKAALLEIFSNRILPDGRPGVFHPDNFTFGQPVYLSRLYAAAQAVDGVASVQVTTFQRQGILSTIAITQGKLELGRLEIARLDNNPNFPDRGVFRLRMEGGK